MKILITGGSRGIGEACVRAFCRQGDHVAFLYHTNHERAQALANETGAIAIAADVSPKMTMRLPLVQILYSFSKFSMLTWYAEACSSHPTKISYCVR